MSNANDGGPAFACSDVSYYQKGMTLRDYFAGQALAGRLSNGVFYNAKEVACVAYIMADAMLAERNKHETKS